MLGIPYYEKHDFIFTFPPRMNEEECPICYETTELTLFPHARCAHALCAGCIVRILKISNGVVRCPLCRAEHVGSFDPDYDIRMWSQGRQTAIGMQITYNHLRRLTVEGREEWVTAMRVMFEDEARFRGMTAEEERLERVRLGWEEDETETVTLPPTTPRESFDI